MRKNSVQCGDATCIYISTSAILIRAVAQKDGLKTKNEAAVIYLPPTPEQVPESQTSPNCFWKRVALRGLIEFRQINNFFFCREFWISVHGLPCQSTKPDLLSGVTLSCKTLYVTSVRMKTFWLSCFLPASLWIPWSNIIRPSHLLSDNSLLSFCLKNSEIPTTWWLFGFAVRPRSFGQLLLDRKLI